MKKSLHLLLASGLALLALQACSDNNPTAVDALSSSDSLISSSGTQDLSSSSTTPSPTAWYTIPANHPKINVIGRYDNTVPTALVSAWSGSAWEIRFNGTSAKILLEGQGSVFNVFVDSDTVPTSVLDLSTSQATEHLLAENLSAGTHTIKVFKRTEAQYGNATFMGFQIYGDSNLVEIPALTRKIEFVGNSITCGYGNLDSVKEHSFDILTEDHFFTYVARSARAVNADFHSVCFSGRGVYRSNIGNMDDNLPQLFNLVSPNTGITWDFSRWTPDVVTVNLGTNDFYQGIPDSVGFVQATIQFVKDIRGHYPLAKILILDGPMLSDYYPTASEADVASFPTNPAKGYPSDYFIKATNGTYTFKSQTVCKRYLNAAKEALATEGEVNVARFSFPAQSASLGYGADWHPSFALHAKMAELLTGWIQTQMGW